MSARPRGRAGAPAGPAGGRRIRPRYHHGNLERALVHAGLAIVEKGGVEALSLRAVARRAKVSAAAPYHHFTDKSALLAAIAASGFDRMVDTIRDVAASAGAGAPADRLRAVGRGYVQFALAHPRIFRLMFRPELTRPAEHPGLKEAEGRAFASLMDTIVALQRGGEIAGVDPRTPAAFAWSTVHGLALLRIDEVLLETPLAELRFEEAAGAITDAIVSGLRAHPWS